MFLSACSPKLGIKLTPLKKIILKKRFKLIPVFITDESVLKIPIHENGDPLIDLREQKEILWGPSPEIPNNKDYTYMRKTVYEKLVQAQKLLPQGIYFCIYEGYRSLNLQQMLFDRQYARFKKDHPTWSHEKIHIECTRLVSPVVNLDHSLNIPPHNTGGAIDIYLIRIIKDHVNKTKKIKMLPMGIHPKDAGIGEDKDGSLSLTKSLKISSQARHYRNIMSQALRAVGFTNYDTEYWHWSFGDRYDAFKKNLLYAVYGSVLPLYENKESQSEEPSKITLATHAIKNISHYFTGK
jgi:D-alanyl-D-alanine dipeptidase